jgi:hypothetical protein
MIRKKRILFFCIFVLACGCAPKEETVISINGIKETKQDFEKAFEKFNFGKPDTKEARKEFIDNFVNRKLLFLEAERTGLNKDPQFLQDVQDFWEQSLLKLVVDRKAKELFMNIRISDNEVQEFFNSHKEKYPGKNFEDVYPEIRLLLFKEKQQKAVGDWLSGLKQKSNLKINYRLLGLQ